MAKYYPERDLGVIATLGGGATYIANKPSNIVSRRYIPRSKKTFIKKALDVDFKKLHLSHASGRTVRAILTLGFGGNVAKADAALKRQRYSDKNIRKQIDKLFEQRRIKLVQLGKYVGLAGIAGIVLGNIRKKRANNADK